MSEPTTEEVIAVLVQMRAKVAQGWCRGAMSKRKNGETCSAYDPEASEWCLVGAQIFTKKPYSAVVAALETVLKPRIDPQLWSMKTSNIRMVMWNDRLARDQAEVLEVLDEAIAKLHEEKS